MEPKLVGDVVEVSCRGPGCGIVPHWKLEVCCGVYTLLMGDFTISLSLGPAYVNKMNDEVFKTMIEE